MTRLPVALSVRVEVVVPFEPNGDGHREAAWAWCRTQYPWPVSVAQRAQTGTWSKGAVVMPAIQASSAELIVLADADVYCEGLERAVEAVANGKPWARPHNSVVRLSEEGTRAFMAGEPWNGHPLDRPAYIGIDGGGMLVAPRETFLEIPMDPRFTGWGSEDHALGFAFYARHGPICCGTGPLIHLWHPPQPEWKLGERNGSQENEALWRRYRDARSDPAALDQLLQEARELVFGDAHQPTLHDHSPSPVGSH